MNIYKLVRHGRQLLGEDMGAEALARVVEALRASGQDQVFRIDMGGIEFMDFSFGTALFVTLLQRIGDVLEGYRVVLLNCSPYAESNLDILLTHHGLVVMTVRNGAWKLIGAYAQKDRDVLEHLATMKTATNAELREHLGVSASTCQKRLSRLVKMGLVARQKADKARAPAKYVYFSIV